MSSAAPPGRCLSAVMFSVFQSIHVVNEENVQEERPIAQLPKGAPPDGNGGWVHSWKESPADFLHTYFTKEEDEKVNTFS